MEKKKPIIITVAGKGGVGKTSISASIVKILASKFSDKKILAIDADPAVGLSTALAINPTSTIDDIRKNIIESVEDGRPKEAIEYLGEARYKIFDAMVETDGFAFIAVGRPESAGCYCKINSYLKEVISLVADEFDYVVIDGEAGIEQINRRVMERVTHLLLISDTCKKGTEVIKTIKKVADDLVMYDRVGAIINRVRNEELLKFVNTGDIEIISYIKEDDNLNAFDTEGKSILNLPVDSNVVTGALTALKNIGII